MKMFIMTAFSFIFLASITVVESAYAKLSEQASPAEQRVSNTGAIFTSDTTNFALGEAYRVPSGLIWGSVVQAGGKAKLTSEYYAEEYCKAAGARLPTRAEFEKLRVYLGYASALGYSPYLADGKTDVLPGLSSYWFWSSSVDPDSSVFANFFNGGNANIDDYHRIYHCAIRCVVGR